MHCHKMTPSTRQNSAHNPSSPGLVVIRPAALIDEASPNEYLRLIRQVGPSGYAPSALMMKVGQLTKGEYPRSASKAHVIPFANHVNAAPAATSNATVRNTILPKIGNMGGFVTLTCVACGMSSLLWRYRDGMLR